MQDELSKIDFLRDQLRRLIHAAENKKPGDSLWREIGEAKAALNVTDEEQKGVKAC